MRQFLPRLVFVVGIVAVSVQLAVARSSWRTIDESSADGKGHQAGSRAAEDLLLAFIAALPPLMLLLGPWAPLTLALFAVLLATLGLMMSRGTHLALRRPDHAPGTVGTIGLLALILHLATWHFFFGTGHRAQFNSLHYACPFVGFDTFNYWRCVSLSHPAFLCITRTFLAPAYRRDSSNCLISKKKS